MNMKYASQNLLDSLPDASNSEVFERLAGCGEVMVERIVSRGQSSPEQGWYDQKSAEWVMVVSGEASLEFDNGEQTFLQAGDYVLIPPHARHRVAWTAPDQPTVWLAVHFPQER
ncbi:cupin domain-containing protein [Marinobacterium litorale]|uniref:cupin domain-containing protein n=1 Tax=Marinobacterium litorale TaxID=404770 RepID=UPI000409DDCF|nr:cupin domain-containing protein [Marinobacterium litorale]